MEAAKANTGLKKRLSELAKEASLEHHFATFEGKPGGGLKYKLGKKVVMSKVSFSLVNSHLTWLSLVNSHLTRLLIG